MKRYAVSKILFATATLLLCTLSFAAMAAEAMKERDISIKLEPALQEMGINATKAAAIAAAADSEERLITVFTIFDQPFYGELYLKGFREDGTEVARSAFTTINQKAGKGGNIRFSFDKDTNLNELQMVLLDGSKKAAPPPKEESWGEKATNIVKELFN